MELSCETTSALGSREIALGQVPSGQFLVTIVLSKMQQPFDILGMEQIDPNKNAECAPSILESRSDGNLARDRLAAFIFWCYTRQI